MFELPTSIIIDGIEHPIRNKGDFRMVLDCFKALQDEELSQYERVLTSLVIFYDGISSFEDLSDTFIDLQEPTIQMYKFFNCGEEDSLGVKSNYNLVDWDKDSQIICASVNKVAGKEIRAESYIHWWTFMGYYLGIEEGVFSTVINIRHKMMKGKQLEKYESDFKRDNPNYFTWDSMTAEQKELDAYIREMWESNSSK